MATRFSGTPFGEEPTREIVATTERKKPGPKPGAKAAAAAAKVQPAAPVAQGAQRMATPAPNTLTIDKSLVEFLFSRQEELAHKYISDYDTFIKGMVYIASKPLSPNAPDTLWSNFLSQLIARTVTAGSKGVAVR